MSEVAGRLAIQVGSWCLQATNGGRGVLLSGVAGVRPGKVVILGAGIAGASACQAAVGLGARVSILDVNPTRLRYVHDILAGHVTTVMSNRANIEEEVPSADLVVGTVLDPGRQGAEAADARPAPQHAAGLGVRRRLDRPGRVRRDLAADLAPRPDLRRGGRGPLLRHQHAGRRAQHRDVRADQHDARPTHWRSRTAASRPRSTPIRRCRRGVNVADGAVWHPGVAAAFDLPRAC